MHSDIRHTPEPDNKKIHTTSHSHTHAHTHTYSSTVRLQISIRITLFDGEPAADNIFCCHTHTLVRSHNPVSPGCDGESAGLSC